MTENKAPRTPEDILWMTLRDIQTQSSAAHSGYSRQADTLIRALGEAGFQITDTLFISSGSEQAWTDADLRTLILTAGEITSHYGTGTDSRNRDDVLSARQRQILARARQQYHAELGEPS